MRHYFCWEQNVLNYVNKLKVLLFMRSQQLFSCRYNVWWAHLVFKEISYSTAVPTFHPLSGPAIWYSTSARSFHTRDLSIHFSNACHSLLTILFLKIGIKRNNTTQLIFYSLLITNLWQIYLLITLSSQIANTVLIRHSM